MDKTELIKELTELGKKFKELKNDLDFKYEDDNCLMYNVLSDMEYNTNYLAEEVVPTLIEKA